MKTGKLYIGIDPGMGGGLAVIDGEGVLRRVDEMPKTEYDVFEYFKSVSVDTHIYERDNNISMTTRAMIERVHSMPGQGIASAWKFSGNYHGVRMAMIARGIPFDEVNPLSWQQALGIPKRSKTETKVQHKNKLKAKAQQLFPTVKVTLANADALLIAEYARRKGY